MAKLFIILLVALLAFSFVHGQLNYELVKKLDTINNDDQFDRIRMEQLQQTYHNDSSALKSHLLPVWMSMRMHDSINLIKVKAILDKYGWLGSDVVGLDGNDALFGVIQHSDLATQQQYLPVMEAAAKLNRVRRSSLALLQDRVALREGKKQIYGSQVYQKVLTHEFYVLPLIDPERVDERRASVGLPPMDEYLGKWNMRWSVKTYKEDLPKVEMMMKENPL